MSFIIYTKNKQKQNSNKLPRRGKTAQLAGLARQDRKHKEIVKGVNEEGDEGRQVGQINQKSGNKMGGIKTINMRAHGTQKTKTKAMCSHKTKTQAYGQQNKLPAMCKRGHEHAANENTHKPRVHTRHDNMKAHSQ